jgi:hypothetical protein
MSAENTAGKQRGRPFQKGQSGNPDGRPNGSRNATTLALETLLDGQAQAIDVARPAISRLCVSAWIVSCRPASLQVDSLSNVKNFARSVAKMSFEIATFGLASAKWGSWTFGYLLQARLGNGRARENFAASLTGGRSIER